MSAMERTTYRQSLGSNVFAFNESQPNPQLTRSAAAPSPNFPEDDPVPLFLSNLRDQPDPREFEPFGSRRRTSIQAQIVVVGLMVSAVAILLAVASNSNYVRVIADQARISIGDAIASQSPMLATSNQSTGHQVPPKDRAGQPEPVTVGQSGTSSNETIASAPPTAQQNKAPVESTSNEGAAPSSILDAETLATLMTRAKRMLTLGDIAAARLLLERAATAQDAAAAFLLARTYDPDVLKVRDTRSITPDPAMARDWYRKAASLGSADAQQRLRQFQD